MTSWIAIALLAGLASALIFAAAGVPTFAAAAVFLLAPAPLLIAGLGWGLLVTLIAGVAGGAVLAVLIGWAFALPYLLSTALPAAVICRLALQRRPAAPVSGGEGEARAGDVEWYPEGRVLIAIALMAGLLASALVIMAGPDAHSFRASTDQLLDRVLAIQNVTPTSPEQQQRLQSMRALFANLLPAAAAVGWTLSTFANFRLAEPSRPASTSPPGRSPALAPSPFRAWRRWPAGGLAVGPAAGQLRLERRRLCRRAGGRLRAAWARRPAWASRGPSLRPLLLVALYAAVLVLGLALALPLIVTGLSTCCSQCGRVPGNRRAAGVCEFETND